jgi:hypothetical protein
MVTAKMVEDQLRKIGFDFRFWGRNEVKELHKVLTEDEVIKQCVNGHYSGGYALLVATNQRLILVDHKPMFLTMEVIWYDKIGQIDYNHRLLNASICVSTPNKDLNFTTWNSGTLRKILQYSQEKMVEAKEGEQTDTSQTEPASINQRPIVQPTTQPVSTIQPQAAASVPPVQFPVMTPDKVTLYTASRLPFSRRRYYAR